MAYTLGNKCVTEWCKQTILVQLIVEDVVTFFETPCIKNIFLKRSYFRRIESAFPRLHCTKVSLKFVCIHLQQQQHLNSLTFLRVTQENKNIL